MTDEERNTWGFIERTNREIDSWPSWKKEGWDIIDFRCENCGKNKGQCVQDGCTCHLDRKEVDKTKYYEIIGRHTEKVIGVCSSKYGLVSVVEEDYCPYLGEISKAEFDKFGNEEEWDEPRSNKIFATDIVKTVRLTEVDWD